MNARCKEIPLLLLLQRGYLSHHANLWRQGKDFFQRILFSNEFITKAIKCSGDDGDGDDSDGLHAIRTLRGKNVFSCLFLPPVKSNGARYFFLFRDRYRPLCFAMPVLAAICTRRCSFLTLTGADATVSRPRTPLRAKRKRAKAARTEGSVRQWWEKGRRRPYHRRSRCSLQELKEGRRRRESV